MARRAGSENDLIKCEYCGEMYSVTYKHCPFCNEDGTSRWDDPVDEEEYGDYEEYEEEAGYEDEPRKDSGSGGKRLAGGGGGNRGGRGRKPSRRDGVPIGRIIGTVLSLALIVAAVCIVASIAKSLFGKGKEPPAPSSDPTPPAISDTVESPQGSEPVESETPSVQPTVPSVVIVEPTSFKLNASDLTFDAPGQIFDMKAIFTPSDATAQANWSSSNPNIAAVSFGGRVTAVGKGTCTITCTVEGLGSQTCIFRCNFKDSSSSTTTTQNPSTSTTPGTSTDLTLSRSDFTLAFEGDKWQLKVTGTSSTVTWASSNASVATVSSDGTVVAVGKGTCNVTATVDGVTLKCIVRCSW